MQNSRCSDIKGDRGGRASAPVYPEHFLESTNITWEMGRNPHNRA